MLCFVASGDAVFRNDELQIAHVCIIGREQDAAVGRNAGEHQPFGAEMLEQQLERRLVKS